MSYRTTPIVNIRTVKALRGEILRIDLGKTYTGALTAWMKRDPNDTTYRSFEIEDGRYLILTAPKASDYVDGEDVVVDAIAGSWMFDVEETQDDLSQKTIARGTILFQNDITNSAGVESIPATVIPEPGFTDVDSEGIYARQQLSGVKSWIATLSETQILQLIDALLLSIQDNTTAILKGWRTIDDGNYGIDYNSWGGAYPNVNTGYFALTNGESCQALGYGDQANGYDVKLRGQLSYGWGQIINEDLDGHAEQGAGQNYFFGGIVSLTHAIENFLVGSFLDVEGDRMADTDQRGRGNTVFATGADIVNHLFVSGRHQKILTAITQGYPGTGFHGVYNGVLGGLNNEIQPSSNPLLERTRLNGIVGGLNLIVETDVESSAMIGGESNTVQSGVKRAVVLGGNGILATDDDTAHAQRIKINGNGGQASELVMYSPNGTEYIVTVSDAGVLTVI